MPGFDGTGPMGYGPMTGRGGGYCIAYHCGQGYARPRCERCAGLAGDGVESLVSLCLCKDQREWLEEQASWLSGVGFVRRLDGLSNDKQDESASYWIALKAKSLFPRLCMPVVLLITAHRYLVIDTDNAIALS